MRVLADKGEIDGIQAGPLAHHPAHRRPRITDDVTGAIHGPVHVSGQKVRDILNLFMSLENSLFRGRRLN
jgi:hypothetical protein